MAAMKDFEHNREIEDKLGSTVNLAKRVFYAFDEVEAIYLPKNKKEIESLLEQRLEAEKRVELLCFLLKTLLRFITAAKKPLFLRPVDVILDEVHRILNHALDIVTEFDFKSLIAWFFNAPKASDFRPLFRSLDDCIANVKWLLTWYDLVSNGGFEGSVVSLPPFIVLNPMFLVIWHCIATVRTSHRVSDQIDAVKSLASLALDNKLYKKYIVQEQGLPPLVKLLEDGACLDAQIAAADALCVLTNDQNIMEKVMIVILHLLKDAPIEVQIQAIELVTEMAEQYSGTGYDSVEWNVILPIVTLLSAETSTDELKTCCAEALWTLAAKSKTNCMTITKTRAMLSLAKLVEKERGKLRYYCLMTIMEITAVAETDIHFRCTVFKTNAASTKAVVDQLLRVIEESRNPIEQIPAIRSIGSLARIFPSHETRIISLLISLLHNKHLTVASEAEIALKKFTSPDNYLCFDHWKSVMKFISLPALMRLIGGGNRLQRHRWDLLIIFYLFYVYQHLRGSRSLGNKPADNNWVDIDYQSLAFFPWRNYEFLFFAA